MVGEWLLQQVQELLSPVLSWLQKLEEGCKDVEDGLGLQKGYGLAERIQIMQADLEEWKGAQNAELQVIWDDFMVSNDIVVEMKTMV